MNDTRVLIIDDEKENVRYLTTILEENGFKDIHGALDGVEGLQKIQDLRPGLILLDLRMPKKTGISVFNDIKQSSEHCNIPVIILTGEGGFLKHLAELRDYHEDTDSPEQPTEEVLNRFIDSRPDAFLEKPIDPEQLMSVIAKVLITVDELKDGLKSEVNVLREKKLGQGVNFNGNYFETDERSRNNLTAMVAKLTASGASLPGKFTWRSSDNKSISMTQKDLVAFHSAVTDWVTSIYIASWNHKDSIDALETIEDVEAYDIYKEWPDNKL